MPREVSLLAIIVVFASIGCGGTSTTAASSRCGDPYLTDVVWGGGYGYAGWYDGTATVDEDTGDDWYDPGDGYGDDASGEDDSSGDGASLGDDSAAGGDSTGDDSTGDDSSGDDSSGDDSSGDDSSGDDSSGDDSAALSSNRVVRLAAADAQGTAPNGCWSCTVGCTAAGAGRQGVGVSDASYDDACRAAERAVADWAHTTEHARLERCERIDPSATSRVPAAPTVTAAGEPAP